MKTIILEKIENGWIVSLRIIEPEVDGLDYENIKRYYAKSNEDALEHAKSLMVD